MCFTWYLLWNYLRLQGGFVHTYRMSGPIFLSEWIRTASYGVCLVEKCPSVISLMIKSDKMYFFYVPCEPFHRVVGNAFGQDLGGICNTIPWYLAWVIYRPNILWAMADHEATRFATPSTQLGHSTPSTTTERESKSISFAAIACVVATQQPLR